MKKIITVIALVLIGLTSHSQNLLGESFRDVKQQMNQKGFIIEERLKDGVYRLEAKDNTETRYYYFKEDNSCYAFRRFVWGLTYSDLTKMLYMLDYIKISDGIFTNNKYRAEIEKMENFNEYYITITFK